MTRYVEAFSWPDRVEEALEVLVVERPLLHVCSGRSSFGDVRMDLYELADVRGDWQSLPFRDDSFAAIFADPPWNAAYKQQCARFMREALRVAPVVYLMGPWLYGSSSANLERCWYRQMPGVNNVIAISKYRRCAAEQYTLLEVYCAR